MANVTHRSFSVGAPLATRGSMYFADEAGQTAILGPGTAGQAVLSGGPGADPFWGTPGAVVDDEVSLAEAIAAAIGLGGVGTTLTLEGDIVVNDTITLQGVRWLRWRGGNLIWRGPADRPMLKIIDCADCSFEDVIVTCDEPLLESVRIQAGPTAVGDYIMAGLQTSHLTFSRWTVRGQDQMGVGFRIYVRDGENSVRCDHMRFIDCRVAGYTYAAYHFEGRNSKDLIIENSFTQGISPVYESMYCVDNSRRGPEASGYNGLATPVGSEVFGDGGSYSFTGQCSGNTVANFRFCDRAAVCKIGRCYSEKSNRHVLIPPYGSGSSGALPLELEANHFAVHATQFAADKEVIQNYSYGPITVIGGSFGRPRAGEQVRFRHQSQGAFVMQGTFVANDGDGNVFVYGAPTNPDYTTTNNGFRDDATGPLGVGIVIPTDGPALRSYPQSLAQWAVAGFTPSSQWSCTSVPQVPAWTPNTLYAAGDFVLNDTGKLYKCKSGGTSASSGGPTGTGLSISDGITDEDLGLEPTVWNYYDTGDNVIPDIISVRHMVVAGTVDYAQTRTGFTREFIRLTETSGESIRLNYTGYSPITDAVAVVLDFEVVAVGGTRKLIQLGATNTGVGSGGLLLELNSAGNLLLCHDGDVADVGSYVYEADGEVHRVLVGWDPAANAGDGDFFFATDEEFVRWTPAVVPITPSNNGTKGFGANSGTAPDVYITYPVWFYGDNARAIMAPAGRTFLGVDATP